MIKVIPYYRYDKDIQEIGEPYKAIAIIIDRLYLKGPHDNDALSYSSFLNIYALSCIRTIAEDLAKHTVSFVNQSKKDWTNLLNLQRTFTNDFDRYSVPNNSYRGTIFGGVYYALAISESVDEELLGLLEAVVSVEASAVPYFNVFKDAVEKKKTESGSPKQKGKKDEVKKLSAAEAGLFCEVFLASRNITYSNKKETIAPLASALFGWASSTMERNLVYSNDDKNNVADIFKGIDPKYSEQVRNFDKKEAAITTPSGDSEKGKK